MQPDQIRYLLEYNIWADDTVLKGARQLSHSQLRDKIGIAWESAFDTLVHIMAGQRIWLSRWKGVSPATLLSGKEPEDLDQLAQVWNALHEDYRQFFAVLSADRLNGAVSYQTTDGKTYTHPLLMLILHIFNHSTEHRAQVVAVCNMAGHDTGWLDLIHYMREIDPTNATINMA
jgi:uncharacterized damage-inducible protein DinB